MRETGCDEYDPQALTVVQAQARIKERTQPVAGIERVALREALGRVLAHDLVAPFAVPLFANSAMDGYAVRFADLQGRPERLEIIGEARAGHPFTGELVFGGCVRIMTGAVLPPGADTVVMQEQVTHDHNAVVFTAFPKPGQHIRHPGDDLKKGERVLAQGRRLNAADLGILAALGIAEIHVRRRPRAVLLSTGDELRGIGEPLMPGQIYDSNRHTLFALLTRAHVTITDLGLIPDDQHAVHKALSIAADLGDIVITSGGVSVGEADVVKQALTGLGEITFWKIAVKPGRPLAFGTLGKALFFGLPGNPVSAMVTFALFVRPALTQLAGAPDEAPPRFKARTLSQLKKAPGRTDFQRGILHHDESGCWVESTGLQGSHILTSMNKANCLIELPRESSDVEAGTEVSVIPFDFL